MNDIERFQKQVVRRWDLQEKIRKAKSEKDWVSHEKYTAQLKADLEKKSFTEWVADHCVLIGVIGIVLGIIVGTLIDRGWVLTTLLEN